MEQDNGNISSSSVQAILSQIRRAIAGEEDPLDIIRLDSSDSLFQNLDTLSEYLLAPINEPT